MQTGFLHKRFSTLIISLHFFQIELANRLFVAEDLEIKKDYIKDLEKYFESKIESVNFKEPVCVCSFNLAIIASEGHASGGVVVGNYNEDDDVVVVCDVCRQGGTSVGSRYKTHLFFTP